MLIVATHPIQYQVPLCFGAWLLSVVNSTGRMPEVSYFFSGNTWLGVVGIFAAFRLFDIWKPFPVRQFEKLPGGTGIVMDDVMAGVYGALVLFAAGWFNLY